MAWKIEKWMEEVFPGKENIYSKYKDLPTRDLIITSAASLDLALVQLISLRLADKPKESESFLGVNGDGRAPCGSFGARIQLAVLLDIITKSDAELLRTIKKLRNLYAHSVNVSLTEGKGYKHACKLVENYGILMMRILPDRKEEISKVNLDEIKSHLVEGEDYSSGLILAVFSVYQAYFHRIFDKINRIEKMDFISDDKIEY
jgi:hypothetical protein